MPPNATMRTDDPDPEHTMEDIPLGDESNEIKNKKEPATLNGSSTEQVATTTTSGVLCCKKTRPAIHSGKDLGVWESSLEDRSGPLGIWLLSYLTPLLKLGSHKVLDPSDIGVPSKQDRADNAYERAMETWDIQASKCHERNAKLKAAYLAKLDKCSTEEQRQKVKPPQYKEPSIAWALVKAFGVWELSVGLAYYVISALLTFLPVLILNDLVKFFESGESINDYDGYAPPWLEVVGLGVIPFVVSLLQTRHQAIYAHCAVFVRTAVSTMLYRKALRVSAAARAKTSTGQVVNMMSNDSAQLQRFLQFVGMTMTAPIQIVLALVLIYQQVGNATWVGVGFMVFLAPVNTVVFSIVSKQRRKVLKYSDLRVKMMNEILAGIRIIKYYAWERPFGKEVGGLRGKELAALTKLAYTSAIGFSLILMSAPLIQPILVFLTYIEIQDTPLNPATAFTTVALFNIMRFPFAFMPMGLLQYIQSKISLHRLERYLDLPELSQYVEDTPPPDAAGDDAGREFGSVTVRNGTFSWVDPEAKPVRPVQDDPSNKKKKAKKERRDSQNSTKQSDADMRISSHSYAGSVRSDASASTKGPTITLQDLNFQIKAGSLVAVVGSVGSGKSSFLSALLGELEPIGDESKVYIPRPENAGTGFVSYCAQTPWVVNDTLRGNVLFGREYNEERYMKVVEASALVDDLAALPAGDSTEIGEKGKLHAAAVIVCESECDVKCFS